MTCANIIRIESAGINAGTNSLVCVRWVTSLPMKYPSVPEAGDHLHVQGT